MADVTASPIAPRTTRLAELGERLAALRLCEAPALEAMRRSLERHGQLMPIVAFTEGGEVQTLDGFKRLRAARALGWASVTITLAQVADGIDAKIQLAALHQQRGLTELEEGWLVRSLYRDDHLSQPEIARRLDRHKSWVCRRLILVEALAPAVQADVRLGLLAPRAAIALAAVPRGNQEAAAAVVVRRGLTVLQSEHLVAELHAQPEAARAAWLAQQLEAGPPPRVPRPARAPRGDAADLVTDIATLVRVSARLQSRLLGTPVGALAGPASEIVLDGLGALAPALAALTRTIATVLGQEPAT